MYTDARFLDSELNSPTFDPIWRKIGHYEDASYPNMISGTFTPVFGNLGIKM